MGNTCSNCGSSILPNDITCNSCGSPQKQSASGGFCGNCGTTLASKLAPCSKCGHVKTTFAPSANYGTPPPNYGTPSGIPLSMLYKNSGTALILSIVLGLFTFCGIGQIYVGRTGRGVAILIVGWVLLIIGVGTMGIGLLLYLGFFIWQVYDTNELCKKYNHMLSTSGQPPW